jgi:hypothetical protein
MNRKPLAAVLALVFVGAGLLGNQPLFAADDGLVRIRVEDGEKKALVEIPAAVLTFLDRHQVTREFRACRMEGRPVTLSLGEMMKALDAVSPGRESLLLSVEENGRKKTVTLGVVPGAGSRPAKAPTDVILSVHKKGKDGEPADLKVRLPLSTVEAVLKGIQVEGDRNDPAGALIRDIVPFARDLGTGLLLHVVSDEGEVLLSLE